MFCSKCGSKNNDGAYFCSHCGKDFSTETEMPTTAPAVVSPRVPATVSQSRSTGSATQAEKKFQILGRITLALQSLMVLFGFFAAITFANRVKQVSNGEVKVHGLTASLFVMFIWLGLSYLFTLLGMKKKSTGFLIPAVPFGLLAAMAGCAFVFDGLPIRWLFGLTTVGIYIAMMVLNSQNKKATR